MKMEKINMLQHILFFKNKTTCFKWQHNAYFFNTTS